MVELGVYAVLIYEMLNAVATMVILPTLPFYAMNIGGDALTISTMTATYNLAQMLFSPIVGVLSDRFGKKQILLLGVVCQALCNAFMSFAFTVPVLIVARTLQGVALSTGPVEMSYIMSSVQDETELSRVLSLQKVMGSSGALLGPVLARIFESYGFRILCRGGVVINALNILVLVCLLKRSPSKDVSKGETDSENSDAEKVFETESEESSPSTWSTFKSLLSSRGTAMLLFVSVLFTFGENISSGPSAVFYRDRYSFEEKDMAYYFMCVNISTICWSLVVPWVLRRFGPYCSCISACLILSGMCTALVSLTSVQIIPYVYAATIGLFGSMYGIGFSQIVRQKCQDEMLGSLFGLQGLLNGGAGTAGPILGGAFYQAYQLLPNIITAVFSSLTALLFWTLPEDLPSEEQDNKMLMRPKLRRMKRKDLSVFIGRPIYNDHTFCTQLFANTELVILDPDVTILYQEHREQLQRHLRHVATEPGNINALSEEHAFKEQGFHPASRLRHVSTAPSLSGSESDDSDDSEMVLC
eukprot:TRINITY_DN96540_c0_g1_i1.p1 TRINITY_DN96540_c0_g1~~TRINITY_DN96540_c0_g1_i1.p1  ORF type:complete len:551 (+),score=78.64 TRINITY_DN96540_c0_g1_i1:70-1653(+)